MTFMDYYPICKARPVEFCAAKVPFFTPDAFQPHCSRLLIADKPATQRPDNSTYKKLYETHSYPTKDRKCL